jgi:hypothetical protein
MHLCLLNLGETQGILAAGFADYLLIREDLLQHCGQVRAGDEVALVLVFGQVLYEEFESCLPVERSHLRVMTADQIK